MCHCCGVDWWQPEVLGSESEELHRGLAGPDAALAPGGPGTLAPSPSTAPALSSGPAAPAAPAR